MFEALTELIGYFAGAAASSCAPAFRSGKMVTDYQKIGLGLTVCGFCFVLLGVMLFLDRGFIALGDAMFLAGVTLTIGAQATYRFFTRSRNYKGTAFFFGGFLLILFSRFRILTAVGMALQAYGFFCLFAGFAPTALHFLRQVPFLSKALDTPAVKNVVNKVAPPDSLPM